MSLDDTDLWASRIIDELFDKDKEKFYEEKKELDEIENVSQTLDNDYNFIAYSNENSQDHYAEKLEQNIEIADSSSTECFFTKCEISPELSKSTFMSSFTESKDVLYSNNENNISHYKAESSTELPKHVSFSGFGPNSVESKKLQENELPIIPGQNNAEELTGDINNCISFPVLTNVNKDLSMKNTDAYSSQKFLNEVSVDYSKKQNTVECFSCTSKALNYGSKKEFVDDQKEKYKETCLSDNCNVKQQYTSNEVGVLKISNPTEETIYSEDFDRFFKKCDRKTSESFKQNEERVRNATGKFSFLYEDLKPLNKNSMSDLKGIDDKTVTLGFLGPKRNHKSEDNSMKHARSLTNLCCEYFTENSTKEEMKLRDTKSYLPESRNVLDLNERGKSKSVDLKVIEDINSILSISACTNNNVPTSVVTDNAVPDNQTEVKSENSMEKNFEPLDVKALPPEDHFQAEKGLNEIMTNDKNGKIPGPCDKTETHQIYDSDINKLKHEDFFQEKQIKEYTYDEDQNIEMDNKSEIIQRTFAMVSFYRNICSTVEIIFVRPFANFCSEWKEFIIFVFFLSICMLYVAIEKIERKIIKSLLQYKAVKSENHLDLNFKNDAKYRSYDHKKSAKTSEIPVTFSSKENVFEPKVNDWKYSINVDTKDVLILDGNFEEAKYSIKNIIKNGDDFVEIHKRNMHNGIIKTHEDSFIDIIPQTYEKNQSNILILNEKNFDLDITLASKDIVLQKQNLDDNKSNRWSEFPYSLQKSPGRYNINAESIATMSSKNSDFAMSPEDFDKYKEDIFNSTEIECFEYDKNSECRSKCYNKNLTPSSNSLDDQLKLEAETSIIRRNCNSSLSVNIPSFFSRTDDPSVSSSSSMDEPNESLRGFKGSLKQYKVPPEPEIEEKRKAKSLIDLSSPEIEKMDTLSIKSERLFYDGRKNEKSLILNNKPVIPQNRNRITDKDPKYEDIFEISNDLCANEKRSTIVNDQDFTDTAKSTLSSDNDCIRLLESEINSEVLPEEPKRKSSGSLRRRMSLILQSWKSIQVMQCMKANPKNYKTKKRD